MDSRSEATIPFLSDNEQEYTDKEVVSVDGVFTSKRHGRRYRWGLLLCSISLIIITNIATFSITNWNWKRNIDGICALYTSQSWTPVFDEVDLKYETTTFNGTFFKETIYRQDPSQEVDNAWRALGTEYTVIIVPPEDAERANIALDRLKLGEEYGGPGYPAIFEVMHQLHCLNLLRKSNYLYYDYYSKLGQGPFSNPDQLKPHIGHCLENIRQQLMCTADTGLHPFLWAGNPPHVFPDFNREHKCKNFEAIRDFAERHQGGFDEFDITPGVGELVLNMIP